MNRTAQLIVRKLDVEVVTRLRRRAAEHGRSMEAEHREILRDALAVPTHPKSLKQLLLDMPDVGNDRDFARPPDKARKVSL